MVGFGMAMLFAGAVVAADKAADKPAEKAAGKKDKKDAAAATPIDKVKWGEADGKEVSLFTLRNKNGLVAKISSYGAILVELQVPDKKGKLGDIVVGYDNLADFIKKTPYFGATVGRVCNRIANAQFELDGKTYKLAANNGPNSLHGGLKGWDKVVWDAEAMETPDGPAVKLSYLSKDGEEGFPGNVKATSTYTLTNDNQLRVEMTATTDKATPLNMCHHTYWNMHAASKGGPTGTIVDHELTIHAEKFTPGLPPDGTIKPVAGTPFDFTKSKPIGRDLKAAGSPGMDAPIGYDQNWIVDGDPNAMRPVAKVKEPKSGRVMTVESNQPGVQFYSGIFMDGSTKGIGQVHKQYTGMCLEAQKFPNSINVPAWRKDVILRPGQSYKHVITHKFSTE
jgi:aldose 1-epimerase